LLLGLQYLFPEHLQYKPANLRLDRLRKYIYDWTSSGIWFFRKTLPLPKGESNTIVTRTFEFFAVSFLHCNVICIFGFSSLVTIFLTYYVTLELYVLLQLRLLQRGNNLSQ